jgi:hypothetical protein
MDMLFVERFVQVKSPETQQLSATTAGRVEELSIATKSTCVDLADKTSAHTMQYSKPAQGMTAMTAFFFFCYFFFSFGDCCC